jgi:hypothetical protein
MVAISSRSPLQNRIDGTASRETTLACGAGRNRLNAERGDVGGTGAFPPALGWNGAIRISSSPYSSFPHSAHERSHRLISAE